MKRPRIAITGPRRGAFGPRFLVARAIRYYGGVPIQLGPGDERRLPRYDGVVVTAGTTSTRCSMPPSRRSNHAMTPPAMPWKRQ
ncbi:hypothetical protein UMZ34_12275 [Halopseudomonas pachastrellae]|nr:hypothetical protein UMZ34_12275 [Halopseudomonas pachastrellae]